MSDFSPDSDLYQFQQETHTDTLATDFERGGRNTSWSVEQSIKDFLQNHIDAQTLLYRASLFSAFCDINNIPTVAFNNEDPLHNNIADTLDEIKQRYDAASQDDKQWYERKLREYSQQLHNFLGGPVRIFALRQRMEHIAFTPPRVKYIVYDKEAKRKEVVPYEELVRRDSQRYRLRGIRLYDSGSGFDPNQQLYAGASTKRNDHSAIGVHGEGLKAAAEYMIDKGFRVRTFSINREVKWASRARYVSDSAGSRLGFNINGRYLPNSERPSGSVTDIEIPAAYLQRRFLGMPRSLAKYASFFREFEGLLDPRVSGHNIGELYLRLYPDTLDRSRVGGMIELLHNANLRGKLYGQDLLVESQGPLLFGYNLISKRGVAGRDRNHVAQQELHDALVSFYRLTEDEAVIKAVVERIFSAETQACPEIIALNAINFLNDKNRELWKRALVAAGFDPGNKVLLGGRFIVARDEITFKRMHGYRFMTSNYDVTAFLGRVFPGMKITGFDLRAELDLNMLTAAGGDKTRPADRVEIPVSDEIMEIFWVTRAKFARLAEDSFAGGISIKIYNDPQNSFPSNGLFILDRERNTMFLRPDFSLTDENRLALQIQMILHMAMLDAETEHMDYPAEHRLEIMLRNIFDELYGINFSFTPEITVRITEQMFDETDNGRKFVPYSMKQPGAFRSLLGAIGIANGKEKPRIPYIFDENGEYSINILENGEEVAVLKMIKIDGGVIGIYQVGNSVNIFDPNDQNATYELFTTNHLVAYIKFLPHGLTYLGSRYEFVPSKVQHEDTTAAPVTKDDIRLTTKISVDYTRQDGKRPVTLRELVYNAFDETHEVPNITFIVLDGDSGDIQRIPYNQIERYPRNMYPVIGIEIEDDGANGYSPVYLRALGKTRKAGRKTIGQFGDGLKEAILGALQANFHLQLSSQDWSAVASEVEVGSIRDFAQRRNRPLKVLGFNLSWYNERRKGSKAFLSIIPFDANGTTLTSDELRVLRSHQNHAIWREMIDEIDPRVGDGQGVKRFILDQRDHLVISSSDYLDVLGPKEGGAPSLGVHRFGINGAAIKSPRTPSIFGYNIKLSPSDVHVVDTRTRSEEGTNEDRLNELLTVYYNNLTDTRVIERILSAHIDNPQFLEARAIAKIRNPEALKAWRETFKRVYGLRFLSLTNLSVRENDPDIETKTHKAITHQEEVLPSVGFVRFPDSITRVLLRAGVTTGKAIMDTTVGDIFVASASNAIELAKQTPRFEKGIYELGQVILTDPELRAELERIMPANEFAHRLELIINKKVKHVLRYYRRGESAAVETKGTFTEEGLEVAVDPDTFINQREFKEVLLHELMHMVSMDRDFSPRFVQMFVLFFMAADKVLQAKNRERRMFR